MSSRRPESITATYHYGSGGDEPGSSAAASSPAAASSAEAVKERIYDSLIQSGMAPAMARQFADTAPEQLVAANLEGAPRVYDEYDDDDSDYDSDYDGAGFGGGGGGDDDESGEFVDLGEIVTVGSISLIDEDGGKFKVNDAASRHKSASLNVRDLGASLGTCEIGDAPALAISWDGQVQLRLRLGKPKAYPPGGGEFRVDLNGEVPERPLAASDYSSDLYAACCMATDLKVVLGGHWTDAAAEAKLARLWV